MIIWSEYLPVSSGSWAKVASFGPNIVFVRPAFGRFRMTLVHVKSTDAELIIEFFDTEEAAKERGELLLLLGS